MQKPFFQLSVVSITINNMINVKLKKFRTNKLGTLSKYIRLEIVNISSCLHSISSTLLL